MRFGTGEIGRRLALAALLAAAASRAGADPPPLLGNESVSSVEGADAVFWNPAAVGLRYPQELLLSFSDEPGGGLRRGALAGRGLGFGVVSERHGATATTLALGGGDRAARLGLSLTRWSGSGPGATDATLGFLAHLAPWAALGGTAAHLAQPSLAGERLIRDYTLGLGLRPFALSPARAYGWGSRLTATCDLRAGEKDRPQDMRARFGADLEIVPGLVARGGYENRAGYQLGFAVLAPRLGYHGHRAYDPDGHRLATTHALSFHPAEDRTVLPAPRRVGELRMEGALGDDALSGLSVFGGPSTTPAGVAHRALERALDDPRTRGVLLELRGITNMAQVEELRRRVLRLRGAGKPVVAWLPYGGGRADLYLASSCDRIVTTEEAEFGALGLRVERRSYKSALADLGLRIDRSSVGAYKSAYRNFSVDSTPPADREVIEHTLDQVQELFVDAVVADRHMSRERLLTLLDGRQWPAADLQRAGLVDSLGDRRDAMRILGRLAGLGAKPMAERLTRLEPAERPWRLPRGVAVVYASGGIEVGKSGSDLLNGPYMGSETLIPQLERAFKNREVKAVVLRIESPGGSSLASDLMYRALQRVKRETKKPLVVSMGSVAASGGYQIALPGDRLFADHFTRTGSIGVLFVKPSLEGFYAKRGVRQEDFERGDYMSGWSLARDWDRRAQAAADSAVRRTYTGFKDKVGAARKLSAADVEKVAQGRVWLGEEARTRALVDEMGGLEEAMAEARRLAGVPVHARIDPLVFRRPPPDLLSRLVGTALREAWERSLAPREIVGPQLRADLDDE